MENLTSSLHLARPQYHRDEDGERTLQSTVLLTMEQSVINLDTEIFDGCS